MWTSNLEWPGKTAFNESPFNNWTVQGKVAGYVKAAKGLTFLEIANAGHLAPMVHSSRTRQTPMPIASIKHTLES
jgi:carboxypeptidase C (cathepsin A)